MVRPHHTMNQRRVARPKKVTARNMAYLDLSLCPAVEESTLGEERSRNSRTLLADAAGSSRIFVIQLKNSATLLRSQYTRSRGTARNAIFRDISTVAGSSGR